MRRLPALTFPIKLDIGCGKGKIDEHIGFDVLDFGQEIVWNINDGIPLPDNSVSAIFTSHFVEHLKIDELANFFSEVVRVAINEAPFEIWCPHSDTIQAHYLCHYSFWDEDAIKGIVEDCPNLELLETRREGYHFIAKLKIKK